MHARRAALRFVISIAVLLVLLWGSLALLPKEPAPLGDLAITFLGVTNHPVRSFKPVRLEMLQGTTGLCAIFQIANVTRNQFLQFDGAGVERLSPDKGATNSFTERYSRNLGSRWAPGYSCLYAFSWPAEVPTNESWRLVLTVQREPRGIRRFINNYSRARGQRDIFTLLPYAKHTVRSTEADARIPFEMPE